MINTDSAWKKWGADDPYYGVLSDDRFRAASIAAHRDEFFESGQAFVDDALALHEDWFGPLARGRALDHGCGVGRLSLPLARAFERVTALDVAPAMLAEARANASEADADNIVFTAADDDLSAAEGPFDYVLSLMVLQHIPVRRGLAILDALLDRVAPGGGFYVHLSVRTDRGFLRWLYWASANVPGVKIWQNIRAGRAWNAPAMQMNHYPLDAILERMRALGFDCAIAARQDYARFATVGIAGRLPAD